MNPIMPKCCRAVYMDESGLGSKNADNKSNFWVSVGVSAKLDDHKAITEDLELMRKKCMRLYNKELKGTDISPNHLNPGITKETVAEEISSIIEKHQLVVWVTSVKMTDRVSNSNTFTASNKKHGLQAKDVAREILLERISMKVGSNSSSEDIYQLIWDLSDNNELIDFSAIVSSYVNPHNNKKVSPLIIPHILGGLSHDWAELQIADLISNYALNYSARGKFNDCDEEKSDAFKKHIYPMLYRCHGKTEGCGWKYFE